RCGRGNKTAGPSQRPRNGLGGTWSQNRTFGRTGFEYATDVGHDTGCCNYPRESRGKQVVGRHNGGSTGCQDRTASPWRTGDRALRGKGPSSNALGQSTGTER